MFLKFTINAFGENFEAKNSISLLDIRNFDVIYEDDYKNHISFVHSRAIVEYWDEEYEKSYLEFIEKNMEVMVSLGADDFDIFISVYKYELEQCNFEILSPAFFYYINKYKIRIPISVYTVDDAFSIVEPM